MKCRTITVSFKHVFKCSYYLDMWCWHQPEIAGSGDWSRTRSITRLTSWGASHSGHTFSACVL